MTMKFYCIILFTISSTARVYGQEEDSNRYLTLPYKHNSFVTKANISWASEKHNVHSFDGKFDEEGNIHTYLLKKQKNGTLKSFLTNDYDTSIINKWAIAKSDGFFSEISKEWNNQLEGRSDSITTIDFHEILYFQNNKLKSHIVAAGPQLRILTSNGIYIGNSVTSYSNLNLKPQNSSGKQKDLVYLGKTYILLYSDSLEMEFNLKKTFGMPLSLNMWYALSKGFNKVNDLKRKTTIRQDDVLNYSPFDSVEVIIPIDSIVPLRYMTAGAPAYHYFSDIGLSQEWFYNKKKKMFFNRISSAFLYIRYYDEASQEYLNEKRFEISFE